MRLRSHKSVLCRTEARARVYLVSSLFTVYSPTLERVTTTKSPILERVAIKTKQRRCNDNRDGSQVEARWKPGGSQVEARWKPGGSQVEARWKPGGRSHSCLLRHGSILVIKKEIAMMVHARKSYVSPRSTFHYYMEAHYDLSTVTGPPLAFSCAISLPATQYPPLPSSSCRSSSCHFMPLIFMPLIFMLHTPGIAHDPSPSYHYLLYSPRQN
ncbi:Calcium-transporting ATPase type 2C member 1 [Venturia nashicola]|nr:Calcium-transporting ATPase type 2C member 1 [Venturia nashicola]